MDRERLLLGDWGPVVRDPLDLIRAGLVLAALAGRFGSELQESNDDTVGDLAADALGAAIGAGLLLLWTRKGWGSVRRVPGTTREAHE